MKRYLLILAVLCMPSNVWAMERLNYTAPSELPNVSREMKTAGYWISRHSHPDQVIMSSDAIQKLNQTIRNDLKLTKDITAISNPMEGSALKKELKGRLDEYRGKEYFIENGRQLKDSCLSKDQEPDSCEVKGKFFSPIEPNLNLSAISKEVQLQYGLIVHYAHQRFLPTEDILTAEAKDVDFDELQNSALDVGTPVAILHESKDGQWLYTQSSASAGWIKKENIALASLDDIKSFSAPTSFVVVTVPKAEIFLNSDLTQYYDYVQMSTTLPITKFSENAVEVSVPTRASDGKVAFKTGYLNKEDAHPGYLAYTPRNIIKQAFRMLNVPYGWGGMYGEQDCSRFLQEVFGTVGIYLPRDSKDQAKVGISAGTFDEKTDEGSKLKVLAENAIAGESILPMKGHIMLYLGMVEGRPYAIHATWAYRQKMDDDDIARVVNRVIVSDLSLGEGSKKGSLLSRLQAVKNIQLSQ